MKKSYNPISFTPLPVTIITSILYAGLLIALILVHVIVPPAPQSTSSVAGVNLTEAWRDLQMLSNGFHPYNSRRNDQIHDWLLQRLDSILTDNRNANESPSSESSTDVQHRGSTKLQEPSPVVVFNDIVSNVTFSASLLGTPGLSVYFEGTNIIVYIRGSEDDQNDWWTTPNGRPQSKGGVLVNAHYDSVSTGYGATDDGVGVVSILQLIKHFTSAGQQPKKGIVALFNNGEEDYLNGARAFTQHSMSKFVDTFLNLEGAGAGGRATLFRSTDTEITRFYQGSSHPFGTVVSSEGFRRGFVKSETDYAVFDKILGLRGLDVAFMEPRARYHTSQDDTRHTSRDSLWHMLSAAIFTVESLAQDTSSTFEGKSRGKGRAPTRSGSDAVWFDLFGGVFAVFQLQTLFAISVTLLVVAPIVLIVVGFILFKVDKFYLFSSSKQYHHSGGDDSIPLQGWRGFFRYPFIFALGAAGVIGLAFLIAKVNPYIIYSSPYAIWSTMLSAWVFIVWFLSRATDFVRPTAFHRVYALLWMFSASWLALIAVTVLEERFKIAAGYFVVFYFAAIALATIISFLELFGLSRKMIYVDGVKGHEDGTVRSARSGSISSSRLLASTADEQPQENSDGEEVAQEEQGGEAPTESTALLRSGKSTAFANYMSPGHGESAEAEEVLNDTRARKVYGYEQAWSWSLPTWTWLLQVLIMAPVATIFIGQISLLFTSGTYQTLSDGSSPLLVYVLIAVFSLLILSPIGPFVHRYTYHIPTFLLCVFTGTLIYNLTAFPFSSSNRLKVYFVQEVDLDTGLNKASLSGIGYPFLDEIVQNLPSASGQSISCSTFSRRPGLTRCAWSGLPPRVVSNTHPEVPPSFGYADWLSFNISRQEIKNSARFHLWGRNTRACKIIFNRPISDFSVDAASGDSRFPRVADDGSKEIRLWSRTWEKPWDLTVRWESDEDEKDNAGGLDGRIVCLWNDENGVGVIPALDEIRRFAPDWAVVSKLTDGLVEGSKAFLI